MPPATPATTRPRFRGFFSSGASPSTGSRSPADSSGAPAADASGVSFRLILVPLIFTFGPAALPGFFAGPAFER